MMKRLSIPLLGLVENMSYFVAPDTGKRYDIFGHGGGARMADAMGMPFLGEIPLDMAVRETSDAGRPVVATDAGGVQASAFRAVARALLSRNPALKP
jgi:ATP-binding protein involved in chromosome partitioning